MTQTTSAHHSPLFDTSTWCGSSYREAFSSPGVIRSHWHPVISEFQNRGEKTLTADHEKSIRMRYEDGATINPFTGHADQQATPWELDILPLLITTDEWRQLETGLIQRAMLLERIIADIYGDQQLVKSGALPPEIIHANPRFLYPCHGIFPSSNRYLSFYAADVYRNETGGFSVLRDHGESPKGLGYALENRIVMSRLFPELYHRTQIRRLAPFFNGFHRALMLRSSLRKEDPGICLFTSGPDNPLYFEHALLSRYLGYPLVEGQDLTVRNGKIFLKKLAGLEPVEALFRMVDDRESDPFALRRKTSAGVAGLIQVSRENGVDITNPIGGGFIDTPLLCLFLSELCRHIMGEELLLPSHPGWWCKNEDGLQMARNIPGAAIIPAFDRKTKYSDEARDELLQHAPYSLMVTAPLIPSFVPSWQGVSTGSSRTIMRIFLCATENGFIAMPGGLALQAPQAKILADGTPQQQQSKDIWVLADGPVEPFTLLDSFNEIPEFKRSGDLPSRSADNLLWLGRYLERAETLIRLLRPLYLRLSGEDRPEDMVELGFLLNILKARHGLSIDSAEDDSALHYSDVYPLLSKAIDDETNPNSLIAILKNVQNTARNVRDRLSTDSFRILSRLDEAIERKTGDHLDLLDHTLFTLSGFSGMAMESMTRGLGWRFMDMGRRLERGINQADLIRLVLPHVCKDARPMLQALLEVSDSLMTYRARYRSSFQLGPVLDLLLTDETNPKSLAFQLSHIVSHVENLPRPGELKFSSSEEKLSLDMLTSVRLLDLRNVSCEYKSTDDGELTSFLMRMDSLLSEFSQQLSAHYLSRVPATPHYGLLQKGLVV